MLSNYKVAVWFRMTEHCNKQTWQGSRQSMCLSNPWHSRIVHLAASTTWATLAELYFKNDTNMSYHSWPTTSKNQDSHFFKMCAVMKCYPCDLLADKTSTLTLYLSLADSLCFNICQYINNILTYMALVLDQ